MEYSKGILRRQKPMIDIHVKRKPEPEKINPPSITSDSNIANSRSTDSSDISDNSRSIDSDRDHSDSSSSSSSNDSSNNNNRGILVEPWTSVDKKSRKHRQQDTTDNDNSCGEKKKKSNNSNNSNNSSNSSKKNDNTCDNDNSEKEREKKDSCCCCCKHCECENDSDNDGGDNDNNNGDGNINNGACNPPIQPGGRNCYHNYDSDIGDDEDDDICDSLGQDEIDESDINVESDNCGDEDDDDDDDGDDVCDVDDGDDDDNDDDCSESDNDNDDNCNDDDDDVDNENDGDESWMPQITNICWVNIIEATVGIRDESRCQSGLGLGLEYFTNEGINIFSHNLEYLPSTKSYRYKLVTNYSNKVMDIIDVFKSDPNATMVLVSVRKAFFVTIGGGDCPGILGHIVNKFENNDIIIYDSMPVMADDVTLLFDTSNNDTAIALLKPKDGQLGFCNLCVDDSDGDDDDDGDDTC
jgi:hypothetical protein